MTYWLCKGVALFLRRSKRVLITRSDVVHGSRYIVAANHQSLADTFMILSQIPYRTWCSMGTLRYFTARGLFKVPVLRVALMALGCFPARTHQSYPSGLDYGVKQLLRGRTVMIFPEGRRTRPGVERAHHGVEVLAKAHPNAMVIPAHIEWEKTRFGRRFRVGIGKPFDAGQMTAQEILDQIYNVPVA